MPEIAISLKNISKKYRLFNSPQDRFWEALHPFNKKYHKEFWALKDVSFDVLKGQTVGIIGRNGSGKSTILQILCSILRPTSGEVTVNGRVSALLELGSGFNPEFTGRQNVMMKGMIMGFSEAEMRNRFPEIEAFADIGEFIDQPMKIYSSGMSVRLAFATAINVDPDILVIDEALAVGDARFQHKCYGKFLDFQKTGKTIVFVTHDTSAIVKHCDTAVLLERGAIVEIGEPKEVTNYYIDLMFFGKARNRQSANGLHVENSISHEFVEKQAETELSKFLKGIPSKDQCVYRKNYNKNEHRQGSGKAEIIDYLVVTKNEYDPVNIISGDEVDIYIKAKFHESVRFPLFGFSIKTIEGIPIYALNTFFIKAFIAPTQKGDTIVSKFSVKMPLAQGDFFIDLGLDEAFDGEQSPEGSGGSSAYASLDRRCSVVHLFVRESELFHGYVNLGAEFQQVSKNGRSES